MTVDRKAGTAPSEEVGPGSVNLLTGDFPLAETDVSLFGLSVTRTASSRTPDAGAKQDGQAAVFGPQWTSGTIAELTDSPWSHIKRTVAGKNTALSIVTADGDEIGFTAKGSTWIPEPGAETLTYSATGTGTCAGRPEWADQVCTTGPGGAITGGGTNPTGLATTTNSYDASGRPTTVAVTGGLGEAVLPVTTQYEPATGQAVRSVTSAATITKEYDTLGRQISYSDGASGTTTTTYDRYNRPVTVSDSIPTTTTYTYNHTAEPRGLATKITDSVAGDFTATYDADGGVDKEGLPGGYTITVKDDSTGAAVSREYTRDSDGLLVYGDTVTETIHGQVADHSGWSDQTYTYDNTGRLTAVNDTVGDVCTTRSYRFDQRTNRTGMNSTSGAATEACPTATTPAVSSTFDSADRLIATDYIYDAFGRTTALPGATNGYYANDLVRSQATASQRQTWNLDAAGRFGSTTIEDYLDGTWTTSAVKTNHYDSDSDNPRWITEADTPRSTHPEHQKPRRRPRRHHKQGRRHHPAVHHHPRRHRPDPAPRHHPGPHHPGQRRVRQPAPRPARHPLRMARRQAALH